MAKAQSGHHGTVTHIGLHHSGKFGELTVKHGRKAPRKRDKTSGDLVGGSYDDRPSSNLVIPKHQMGNYHVGQRVAVSAPPVADDGMPDEDEQDDAALQDDDEQQEQAPPAKKKGKPKGKKGRGAAMPKGAARQQLLGVMRGRRG